jgi:LacI family transcriptional regulator
MLVGMKHRHIGVVAGPTLLTTTRDRLDGFQSALIEAGIALPPEHIMYTDFSREGGYQATRHLIERVPHITAIFALNDMVAIGTLAALRERGIVVPDQISVVGFDDIPFARDLTPALTTVRVPMAEMGARAMTLALNGDGAELKVEHLPTELILRASAVPLRAE